MMERGSRGEKKRGKKKMIWQRLDVGDFRLLLLVELALRRREGTLIEDPQEGMIGIGIGGMIDVLNLIEGIVISKTDEIIVEIQGIGPVWVLDQGYVHSLRIDPELIYRHLNHLPTALLTRPHPSLLDFDLHPDAHSPQLAVLDPHPDAHYHQWEDQDPHLGHKVIPTDLIGMVRASHHLEALGIQGRSLLNQCLMRYVSSYSHWSVLMNSRGGRLGNDLLLRE
jgi:hypothetical protein